MVINKEAWKLDDKEWVKARRAEWKEYEYNLKKIITLEKDDFPHFKSYFLTGNEDGLNGFLHSWAESRMVIEMWLHGSNDITIFKKIANKYTEIKAAQNFFKSNVPPTNDYKGVSHFNGKDFNIYKTLFPLELRRADYPELDEEGYKEFCFNKHLNLSGLFASFLSRAEVMPYDYCLLLVPFWREAFINGFSQEDKPFPKVVAYFYSIYDDRENLDDISKNLVEQIVEVLNDPAIPVEAKTIIESVRKG